MATIHSKEIVDDLIKNNGHYSGDISVVVRIVKYTDKAEREAFGIVYDFEALNKGMLYRYDNSENCKNPEVIFERQSPRPGEVTNR